MHVTFDGVNLVLQFVLLALEEGDIELLSGVAPGQVPPHVGIIVPHYPGDNI